MLHLFVLGLGAACVVAIFVTRNHLKSWRRADRPDGTVLPSFAAVTLPLMIYVALAAYGSAVWSHDLPEGFGATPLGAVLAFAGTGALFCGFFAVPLLVGNVLGWLAAVILVKRYRGRE